MGIRVSSKTPDFSISGPMMPGRARLARLHERDEKVVPAADRLEVGVLGRRHGGGSCRGWSGDSMPAQRTGFRLVAHAQPRQIVEFEAARPRPGQPACARLRRRLGGLLAVEEPHAPDQQIEQEQRDGRADEARPEILVVADRLARGVEDRRRSRVEPPARHLGRASERRDVGREREVLARVRVGHVPEALGDLSPS